MNSSAGPHTHRATYPKINTYPQINVAVHFDAFLPANHENLPVDSTARPHTHECNRFFFFILPVHFETFFQTNHNIYLPIILHIHILSSRLTTKTYFSIQLFLNISIDNNNSNNILYSFQREIKAVVRSHNYLSTHLLVYVPTDVPENKSTCIS